MIMNLKDTLLEKILLKYIIDDAKNNLFDYFDLTIGLENYKKIIQIEN